MSFDIALGAEMLRSQLGYSPDDRYAARILGDAPGERLVAEYQFDSRGPSVIGKFHADTAGEHAYAALHHIRRTLHEHATLAVPDALFYDSRTRFLAQRRVEASSFADLESADSRPLLARAGRALRELHTQPVSIGQESWMADHLRDLINPHPTVLAHLRPEYGPSVDRVLAELFERENQFRDEVQPAPIHRDFHLRQLFWDPRRVWLIDFDLFALGDPGLDVGNFLVYLDTHLEVGSSQAACQAFLDGYGSASDPALCARIPVYQAFTWLRLACKRARLQASGWRELTSHHLGQAEKYLDLRS